MTSPGTTLRLVFPQWQGGNNPPYCLGANTHPDIMTPQQFQHAHAMVLGNLLGQGDAAFVEHVPRPIETGKVLYVGLRDPTRWEAASMKRLDLASVSPGGLAQHGSRPVLDWLRSTGASRLAVHFDLDVLDPARFRALLFARPDVPADTFDGIAQGRLSMEQVVQLLGDVAAVADVVGLGIAEHLPWDALALKNMLARLPLIGTAAWA